MGLLDKLKNTFFEEEYVEVEEKPKPKKEVKKEVKKEPKKVEVKRVVEEKPKITRYEEVDSVEPTKVEKTVRREEKAPRREEKQIQRGERVVEKKIEIVESKVKEPVRAKEATFEEKNFKRETNFGYFDDADFLDFTDSTYDEKPVQKIEPIREEKAKPYNNPSYGMPQAVPVSKDEKASFRPTPIISPIYGILDKNYTKDEVIEKKETKPSSYVSRKNADLDSIRAKAFGATLMSNDLTFDSSVDFVEEKEEKKEPDYDIDDNLLYDMTEEDNAPAVNKVTLQDAEEYFDDLGLEYNIDYKDAKLEKATGRRVSKTPKIDDIEEDLISPTNSRVQNRSDENGSLEDNLFDLIDSMYEERE